MQEPAMPFGNMHVRSVGFALRFRRGECRAPELVEQTAGASVHRIGLDIGDTTHWYRVGQSLVHGPAGVECRLWVERELDAGAAPDGLCAATLLLEIDGAQAVSVPMARFLPGTPVAAALRRPRQFPSVLEPLDGMYDLVLSAPDGLPGAVVIEGAAPSDPCVAITPLPDRCPAIPRVYGRDGQLRVEYEFQKELWLRNGERHEVARLVINGRGQDWRAASAAVGALFSGEGYVPPDDRPAWALNATIYEADLSFHGSLAQLAAKLDDIKSQGFDTVYLMPWHRGSYSTVDYQEMAPSYGTFADLRQFSDTAHDRGLRVLFDLLLVIAGDGSPYLTEHPDWFYRDEAGRILPHPVWQGHCFDPASPGFRRFLTDYAVRCCREWGADGFRVDSSAHRGGCWHSPLGLQPHEHSYAVFTLLQELRAAIRAVNPAAILLAECFGPQQTAICDLVGFQWIIWLDWLTSQLCAGSLTGAQLQRIVGEHFLSLPHGTWVTTYTQTHDTLAFAKRDPESPEVAALFATLTLLSAGTMVFGGGWGMRARPSTAEAEEYRRLFVLKSQLGGVACHEVAFPAVGDPALFVATRPSRLGRLRLVTNFSGEIRDLPAAAAGYDEPAPGAPPPPFAAGIPSGSVARCGIDATKKVCYSRLGSSGGLILPYDTVVTV